MPTIFDIGLPPFVLCSFTILIAPISKTLHALLWSRGMYS